MARDYKWRRSSRGPEAGEVPPHDDDDDDDDDDDVVHSLQDW